MCFDGGVGSSGIGKLLRNNFTSEDEIYANCWNYESQSTDQMPFGWTCDEKCFTSNDFVDEVMLNVDMGLYFDFQTQKDVAGKQFGCPGLDNGNWKNDDHGCSKGKHTKYLFKNVFCIRLSSHAYGS